MKENRKKWWCDARFGMFIHWGLYSIPAIGEWTMYLQKIKIHDYEMLANEFNPVNNAPRSWAKLAKKAGMKYMVLTTKHHDGFCLFDSKLTDYTSVKTAARKDLVAEYVEACRAEGLGVGLYYSIKDWHHPNYPFDIHDPVMCLEPDSRQPDLNKYYSYMTGQIKELLTNYGKIDIIWFDGRDPVFDGKKTAKMIRELQPDILINNRLLSEDEDFITPEQTIPDEPIIKDDREITWESCNTMTGNHWGYNKYDKNLRSSKELLELLVHSASSGGNCLLNIGPYADGSIPKEEEKRLLQIGEWLEKYGDSIYAVQAGPACHPEYGRMTRKGNTIYLHVLDWPENAQLQLPPVQGELISASLMNGKELGVNNNVLEVPGICPCEMDTVIKLEYNDLPSFKKTQEKKEIVKNKQVDYQVIEGQPVVVDGEIIDREWCGAKVVKVDQDNNFDYSKERYPYSVKYGYCAYTFRAMHAGEVLYLGFEVESPTRHGRDLIKHEGGDEVRMLLAANTNMERMNHTPESFEISVDAQANTWIPHEDKFPGTIIRHAVKHTEKGYNVVVAIPLNIMLKDINNPESQLKKGDKFKFNSLVIQQAPPYQKAPSPEDGSNKWWETIEPPRPGAAHRVFWKGESVAQNPFFNINAWGLCELI